MIITLFLLFVSMVYFWFSNPMTKKYSALPPSYDLSKIKEFSKVRFSEKYLTNQNFDTIVIGSGIGGLTTAGLLAKSGKKVLVLEQHYVAGGTMHTFELKGVEHETGIHYVGNIQKRMKILDLITSNQIKWSKLGWETPDEIYDEIVIADNHYRFPSGRDNLEAYIISLFPEESEGISKYFDSIEDAAGKDLFFMLKVFPWEFLYKYIKYLQPSYYKYCTTSAYDYIKTMINDEQLIAVLCGQFGDYGPTPKKASFFIHASIAQHYIDGGYYPQGGPSTISESISKFIFEHGGAVLVGKKVEEIILENGRVSGVLMENNRKIYTTDVVSACGIRTTFTHLINEYTEYNDLLQNIPPSVSHFYCFINLKGKPSEHSLKSANMWIYPHNDYEKVMDEFLDNPIDAPIPMFLGFSCKKDQTWNNEEYSNAILLTAAKKEWFEDWTQEKCGNRSEEYKELKQKIGHRLIKEGLYKYFPELQGKVTDYNFATPATTQFYLNVDNGESYGLEMNEYRLLDAGIIRPKTTIPGLYLTGQDVCTLGFTGAMMGGVLTTNVILGYDTLWSILTNKNVIKDML